MVATCLSLHTPSFIVIYLYGSERVCAYMCERGLPSQWCGHVDACFQMLHRPDIVEIICWKLILSTLSPAEERVGTSAPNIRSLVCRYSNSKKPSITATAFARVSARRHFSDNKDGKMHTMHSQSDVFICETVWNNKTCHALVKYQKSGWGFEKNKQTCDGCTVSCTHSTVMDCSLSCVRWWYWGKPVSLRASPWAGWLVEWGGGTLSDSTNKHFYQQNVSH